MEQSMQYIKSFKNLHNCLAEAISCKSPYLECKHCGRKIELSQNGVSYRLKNGWEKCCGYTMRYYME